jgi:hypothetical protein
MSYRGTHQSLIPMVSERQTPQPPLTLVCEGELLSCVSLSVINSAPIKHDDVNISFSRNIATAVRIAMMRQTQRYAERQVSIEHNLQIDCYA